MCDIDFASTGRCALGAFIDRQIRQAVTAERARRRVKRKRLALASLAASFILGAAVEIVIQHLAHGI
jgi:hypothetical protein